MSERRLTRSEVIEWHRQRVANPNDINPDTFPRLDTLSAAFMFQFIPVPDKAPAPPEYVYVRPTSELKLHGDARARYEVFLAEWNALWEAGPLRRDVLRDKRVPPELEWILGLQADVRLVLHGKRHRYDAYAALFHLLPHSTLQLFGILAW